ncbi:hypothetical protein FRC12_017895 [Ceratobasidium sp. 428]|nr:hypothetical protein FRC12_017895 [Ceratobasidium sp. 428]
MHIAIVLAACAALAVADPFALPPNFSRYAPLQNPPYKMEPCTKQPKKQCGRLEVLLDRSNEKAGKTSLAVAIYPATGPSNLFKGILFMNPGGPGGSGVDWILGNAGDIIMDELQGSYTLISWDPRGVGRSYPLVNCFKDGKEERSFWHSTVPDAGLEARGNFTDPEDIKNFYSQEPEVDRLLKELSQRCSKLSPDFLQYVGTDAAVDDMLSLKAHFSPAGHYLVNYWGFS